MLLDGIRVRAESRVSALHIVVMVRRRRRYMYMFHI